jgi:hypothetical protein
MRKTLLMTTGSAALAWLALTGAASAITVTLTPGPAVPPPSYFAALPAGESDFTVGTTVWSGTGLTEKGTVSGSYAAPAGMGDTTYMAVMGGDSETATFATDQTSISIYWGSIDSYNTFVTIDGYSLTGTELASMGATDDGSHSSPTSNEWITISGLGAFKSATFSSGSNSFEFSLGSSVPEPSTWAMMMLGFAGLGYAAFRRNSKGQTAFSAI